MEEFNINNPFARQRKKRSGSKAEVSGADLSGACGDAETRLPEGLPDVPFCLPAYGAPEID